MTLRSIADDLWCADGDVFMPGGVHFPARMTVIRLDDGSLLLHSPLRIDDDLAAELEALGTVRHLVAPNTYHHLYIRGAKNRWPGATTYAAPGLSEKRADMTWDVILDEEAPEAWRGQVDQVLIAGAPKMNEVAMVHRKSRTLIVTDLIFNVQGGTKSWMTPWLLRMFGAWKKTTQSWMWRFLVKDRDAAAQSVETLMALDFDRIIVAHGDIIESDGHAVAEQALRWMRRQPKAA